MLKHMRSNMACSPRTRPALPVRRNPASSIRIRPGPTPTTLLAPNRAQTDGKETATTTASDPKAPKAGVSKGTSSQSVNLGDVKIPTADQFTKTRNFYAIVSDQAKESVADISRHWARASKEPERMGYKLSNVSGSNTVRLQATDKPVMLVLGTGWGAHSLVKVIDTDLFDVVVISPRNHFIFTPMLPATAVGSIEFRSLVDPIRSSNEFVQYFEASCESVDLKNKVALCTAASEYEDGTRPAFEVRYDLLVVAVGELSATFGTPGVEEHCYFMKEINDTMGVRTKIGECFELASLPNATDAERDRLLNFVIVGGGPTGVEFAGTMSDFLKSDLKKKYPNLMKHVKVTLLQSGSSILTQFAAKLGEQAMENLRSAGVVIRTGVRVVKVDAQQVFLDNGDIIPYGLAVWSCGNTSRPLVQDLVKAIPEQVAAQNPKAPPGAIKLVVDPFLRVIGAKDVIAIGDCSRIVSGPLPPTAQVAGQQGAYVAHITNQGYVWGMGGMENTPVPKRVAFKPVIASADRSQTEPPVTSSYESDCQSMLDGSSRGIEIEYCTRPFEFLSLGIMAYVGNDKALTQIEAGLPGKGLQLYGSLAFLLWRSVYITKQVSFRNRVLILFDWLKTRVFGRDISIF